MQTEEDEGHQWQKSLYKKISKKGIQLNDYAAGGSAVSRMLTMAKVLYGLHLVRYEAITIESELQCASDRVWTRFLSFFYGHFSWSKEFLLWSPNGT